MRGISISMQSRHRQLILSLTIAALILSSALVFQAVSATSVGGYVQKSLTMTAGAGGRSYAVVNGTYSYPAIQTTDFNNSFNLYAIDYTNAIPTPDSYTIPGPKIELSTTLGYDPTAYSMGPLSSNMYLPKFLMTHNTTSSVVSPTITLSARDNISLSFGSTTDIQVDVSNVVIATLSVTSSQVNDIIAFTGLVSGATITVNIYDASGKYLETGTAAAGYFAFPFLANEQGIYAFYITSTASSYITVTPNVVQATALSLGQFTSGEITIPTSPVNSNLNQYEYQPSQIVALSYGVSAGNDYAYSFTMTEELSSGHSPYTCYYFEAAHRGDGTPYWGTLSTTGTSTIEPVVSEAPVSGTIYVVLVANYVSRFLYSMGVEPATVLQAPVNQVFPVTLPTPIGMHRQVYKFNLQNESMVRLNYTSSSAGSIYSQLYRLTPSGAVYWTNRLLLNSGTSWIRSGPAQSNYQYSLYMSKGTYLLALDTFGSGAGPFSATIEINAYPIVNYTSTASFNIGVHTTQAFAFNITSAFQYYSFNVTLTSQLNASITYRLTTFDDYNRYLSVYTADGTSAANHGLGNKETSGSWQGVASGLYYVDPGPATELNFNGSESSQVASFIAPATGRYFVIVDLLNGYNTTALGNSNANRWTYYKNLAVSLKIDLSKPNLSALGFIGIVPKYLDSSSGSGSIKVILNATAGVNAIFLTLKPAVDTWTRVNVLILNGTRSSVETLFDNARCTTIGPYAAGPYYTFDNAGTLGFWPAYTPVTNTFGYLNTTYSMEFGALMTTMGILFQITVPAGAAHTAVNITVQHYPTPGFSGLSASSIAPSVPGVPAIVIVGIIVAVVIVVAIVVIYAILRKRTASGRS
jgi:hypothetical protein